MRRLTIVSLVFGLISTCAVAQTTAQRSGTVRGVVFTADPDGGRSVVPATRITLDGPVHLEAQTDNQGNFALSAIPAGSYTIAANTPGMTATQGVVVTAGAVSQVQLEMKLEAVTESTTVTATTDLVDIKTEPSGINAIGESAIRNMPNIDEHFQSLLPLIPGVVRGPDGRINMKGARASQNGSLLNSADVTDPATGTTAINIPIDVVSSVQVLSTPYDPEYGKFTGAVSSVETRPGDFNKFRVSAQNLLPRLRRVDGSIIGLAAFTPRMTVSGPLVKDRLAFTESAEYRYERDPVDSLPPLQSYNRSENFNSYTQLDLNISPKQTATASFAIFPQHLDYYGLNTFTPQPSTSDLNERGYQAVLQHRYVTDSGDLLTSQVSFRRFDADLVPNSDGPYQLLVETTKGGFFNRQDRQTARTEWEETYRSPMKVIIVDDRVIRMSKKISREEFSGTYIGITVFSKSIQTRFFRKMENVIAAGRVNEFFNAAVQELANEGVSVGYTSTDGLPWAEIDDPVDLMFAQQSVFPQLATAVI